MWHSERCPVELKKKILRLFVEEVIVDLDHETQMLSFVIHWKGGSHTRFQMPRHRGGAGQKTTDDDLEIIRKMAVRYGDAEIANVLNRLGRRTGKDLRGISTGCPAPARSTPYADRAVRCSIRQCST